jgi:sec-independent protein translocase protein TatA
VRGFLEKGIAMAMIGGVFGLGVPELVIILVIILIIFGAGRLPEIAGSIGKSIKAFKKATKEPEEIDVTAKPPSATDTREKVEKPPHAG